VTSRTTPRFWGAYRALPPDTQDLARKAYRLFLENPRHPGLQFKKVHEEAPIYSVRVSQNCRALGMLKDDAVVWFWIGDHAEYDRLLKSL
jgi:hypothetical protein